MVRDHGQGAQRSDFTFAIRELVEEPGRELVVQRSKRHRLEACATVHGLENHEEGGAQASSLCLVFSPPCRLRRALSPGTVAG
jgi:hypothetical protein